MLIRLIYDVPQGANEKLFRAQLKIPAGRSPVRILALVDGRPCTVMASVETEIVEAAQASGDDRELVAILAQLVREWACEQEGET